MNFPTLAQAKLPTPIGFLVLFALGITLVAPVRADTVRKKQSFEIWHEQDDCAREAFKKFPDYTRQSNARRDAAMLRCEQKHHLPPRADVGKSPVRQLPDAAAE